MIFTCRSCNQQYMMCSRCIAYSRPCYLCGAPFGPGDVCLDADTFASASDSDGSELESMASSMDYQEHVDEHNVREAVREANKVAKAIALTWRDSTPSEVCRLYNAHLGALAHPDVKRILQRHGWTGVRFDGLPDRNWILRDLRSLAADLQ